MSDKFYGADGTKGTVAIDNGDTTVVGTGTLWLTNGAVPTIGGYSIKMPDGEVYGIDSCAADGSLELCETYNGSNVSGGAYYIIPLEAAVVRLVEMVATILNSGSYSQLAGLAGMSAGDLIQYVGGAWAKRTPTQALLSLFSNLGEEEVPSSGTANIGSAASMKVFISGTTTITSLGTTPNAFRIVRFGGALILTHNAASLILPTGANIPTADGDTAIFASDGSGNWRCYHYQRANGQPLATSLAPTGLLDLSASGAGQIKFPATQNPSSDANTLDDYEEGTWTPTDASGAGLSFSSVSASYTKIGNRMLVNLRLVYPSTADASEAKIGGLPYNAANAGYGLAPGSVVAVASFTAVISLLNTGILLLVDSAGSGRANSVFSGATVQVGNSYQI